MKTHTKQNKQKPIKRNKTNRIKKGGKEKTQLIQTFKFINDFSKKLSEKINKLSIKTSEVLYNKKTILKMIEGICADIDALIHYIIGFFNSFQENIYDEINTDEMIGKFYGIIITIKNKIKKDIEIIDNSIKNPETEYDVNDLIKKIGELKQLFKFYSGIKKNMETMDIFNNQTTTIGEKTIHFENQNDEITDFYNIFSIYMEQNNIKNITIDDDINEIKENWYMLDV